MRAHCLSPQHEVDFVFLQQFLLQCTPMQPEPLSSQYAFHRLSMKTIMNPTPATPSPGLPSLLSSMTSNGVKLCLVFVFILTSISELMGKLLHCPRLATSGQSKPNIHSVPEAMLLKYGRVHMVRN